MGEILGTTAIAVLVTLSALMVLGGASYLIPLLALLLIAAGYEVRSAIGAERQGRPARAVAVPA